MKRFLLALMLFLPLIYASAQDFEVIKHQVRLGETVKMISKKYKVEPSEIYRLNKFAIDGVREGMVLQILVPKKYEEPATEVVDTPEPSPMENASEQTIEITHTVVKGETLFSLSRRYNVPVDEIKALNEEILKKGLQTGQVLTIRTSGRN